MYYLPVTLNSVRKGVWGNPEVSESVQEVKGNTETFHKASSERICVGKSGRQSSKKDL